MRVIWGWFIASAVVLAATAVRAQTPVADEIRTPYPQDEQLGRGPYAAVPAPGIYDAYGDVIPPFQAMRIVRSTGYEPMGRPLRRRWVYTVAVLNPDGVEGRLVLDARTGRVMRFVPVPFDDPRSAGAYNPPGPPPPAFERMNARTSLRPPASVPHVANRTPPAVKPEAPSAQQSSSPAPQQQTAAAPPKSPSEVAMAKPADPKPASPKPSVQLQPTQPMPPVQGLE